MRAGCFIGGFLLALAIDAAEIGQFEARISTPKDRDAIEVILARDAAAATDILEGRYPSVKVLSLRRLEHPAGYEWYVAKLSVAGANLEDTVLAKGSGDARRIFANRFAEGRIVSLAALQNAEGYALFESAIHGITPKVFKDIVFADGISNAQKTLQARYPGARMSSISEVKVASR